MPRLILRLPLTSSVALGQVTQPPSLWFHVCKMEVLLEPRSRVLFEMSTIESCAQGPAYSKCSLNVAMERLYINGE